MKLPFDRANLEQLRSNIEFALWRSVYALPRPFVSMFQLRKLKGRVARAYHCIPFYRELLDYHGVKPEHVKTLEDVSRLPLVFKNLLRSQPPERIVLNSIAPEEYRWAETSGSTGEPFRFPALRPQYADRAHLFYCYRFLLREGVPLSHLLHVLKVARVSNGAVPSDSERHLIIPRDMMREDPESLFRLVRDFHPDMLESRPTVLFELAQTIQSVPRHLRPVVRYIYTYGESCLPNVRKHIEAAFGGTVFDMYGLAEVGVVGVECETHDGFHLNEESVLVEIVDENEVPCAPGEEGRILVTRLSWTYPGPFIRYDTGDRGMILEGYCSCGLLARRLRAFGRTGFFVTLNSRRFYFTEFERIFERLSHSIFRYQIVQIGPARLLVRLVPTERFTRRDARFIREEFKKRFAVVPRITTVRHLEYNRGEKAPHFILQE